MARNPIDGSLLKQRYDKGYWARYEGRPLRKNASSSYAAGWNQCDEELREEVGMLASGSGQ